MNAIMEEVHCTIGKLVLVSPKTKTVMSLLLLVTTHFHTALQCNLEDKDNHRWRDPVYHHSDMSSGHSLHWLIT